MLARNALDELCLDKLIIMPSGDPPHKPEGTPSVECRLAMCRLAFEVLCDTEVSGYELLGGARYTFDTVMMLRERYKPETLYLIMGSDMGDSFDSWYRADELRKLCKLYIYPRQILPVTSTDIRRLLALGDDTVKIPAAVLKYIREERLYGFPSVF
jgi:nicotinate-nucleotide adenylyltransferase